MSKKVILLAVIALLIIGILLVFRNGVKGGVSAPQTNPVKEVKPSETYIEYSDPSGFSFSYPDNLSITKKEVDDTTYADLQLSSKEVNGSLSLKISDSKLKTIDDWVKLNKEAAKTPAKETKLGNLKAFEIKTADRLLLGALDQGIFFSIEIPLVEEEFWMKVYNKLLVDFSFSAPEAQESISDEVTFEGEEVVE